MHLLKEGNGKPSGFNNNVTVEENLILASDWSGQIHFDQQPCTEEPTLFKLQQLTNSLDCLEMFQLVWKLASSSETLQMAWKLSGCLETFRLSENLPSHQQETFQMFPDELESF